MARLAKSFNVETLHHVDHVCALTVHKATCQISKNVVLLADDKLSSRELLVGATRAIRDVLILTSENNQLRELLSERGKKISDEVAIPKFSSLKVKVMATTRMINIKRLDLSQTYFFNENSFRF